MKGTDLTVITVVANEGKSNLADTMVQTVCKFTRPRPKLIICDHGDNQRFVSKYGDKAWVTVVKNNPPKEGNNTSLMHGSGLNKIFPLVTTKRTAIIESDCAVLDYGWDDLDLEKYKLKAPLKGIGVSGDEYYYPCFMVFETEAMKRGGIINFEPSVDCIDGYIEVGIGKIRNKYSDVGWQIGQKIGPDEVKKVSTISCASGNALHFNDPALVYKTCEYWEDGRPIAAHFWRGSDPSRRPASDGKSYGEQRKIWRKIVESVTKGELSEEEIKELKRQRVINIERQIQALSKQLEELTRE